MKSLVSLGDFATDFALLFNASPDSRASQHQHGITWTKRTVACRNRHIKKNCKRDAKEGEEREERKQGEQRLGSKETFSSVALMTVGVYQFQAILHRNSISQWQSYWQTNSQKEDTGQRPQLRPSSFEERLGTRVIDRFASQGYFAYEEKSPNHLSICHVRFSSKTQPNVAQILQTLTNNFDVFLFLVQHDVFHF